MTTKVTVDAHAGWPVKVRKWHRGPEGTRTQAVEIVQPSTTQDFYIHDGMSIEVEEMPRTATGEKEDLPRSIGEGQAPHV